MGGRGSESSLRSPAGNGRPCINPPPPNSAPSPKEEPRLARPGDRGRQGTPALPGVHAMGTACRHSLVQGREEPL